MGTTKKTTKRAQKPAEGTPDLSDQQLQQLVAKFNREREDACAQEVAAVLEKHNCALIPEVVIRGGQTTSSVNIVARP